MTRAGRRPRNEDAWWGRPLEDGRAVAVADGVGGHAAGEVASALAVETVSEEIVRRYRAGMGAGEIAALLDDACAAAHRAILSGATGARAGMATTLTAAIVREDRCIAANCGDSRVQVIRGNAIVAATRDHSYVRRLVDEGRISPDAARSHPLCHIITHALGGEFAVDRYEFSLRTGDVVLLTSDGVHDALSEKQVIEAVATGTCTERVERLVEAALGVSEDNVTAVMVLVGGSMPGSSRRVWRIPVSNEAVRKKRLPGIQSRPSVYIPDPTNQSSSTGAT